MGVGVPRIVAAPRSEEALIEESISGRVDPIGAMIWSVRVKERTADDGVGSDTNFHVRESEYC